MELDITMGSVIIFVSPRQFHSFYAILEKLMLPSAEIKYKLMISMIILFLFIFVSFAVLKQISDVKNRCCLLISVVLKMNFSNMFNDRHQIQTSIVNL